MKKVEMMCEKRPLMMSVLVVTVMMILVFLPINGLFKGFCGEQDADYLTGIVEQIFAGGLCWGLIAKLGLSEQAGFGRKTKDLWVIWPMVLFIFFVGSEFFTGQKRVDFGRPMTVILLVTVYMTTGFFEEILCRGFVQTILLRKWGISAGEKYAAVFVASLMFGMLHFINFLLGKISLLASVTQIVYAVFIGFFMGACLVRCKNIWIPILLHGLIDVCSALDEVAVGATLKKEYKTIPLDSAIALMLIALPLLIIGIIMVRKEFKEIRQPNQGVLA